MKKQFLTFSLILFGLTVSAQEKQRTLGLMISPNMATEGPDDGYYNRRISYTTGVFYDHQLSQRFGINTGLLLATERYSMDYSGIRDCFGINLPESANLRVNAIEVPINLNFCFNPENENGFKALLYSGIMLHHEFFNKNKATYSEEVIVYKTDGYNNGLWADSYMNLGFELRKSVATHYTAAIGIGSKFRPAHSLDLSSNYRDPIILNLNLKFGRNL